MPAASANDVPTTESTGDQVPCCPSPTAACMPGLCAAPATALLPVVTSVSSDAPAVAAPSLRVAHWVSYTHAPEPPPPRA